MSKRAPQKGNNEIEVDKYRFRENNTPQTTYSLKSYRFKDRETQMVMISPRSKEDSIWGMLPMSPLTWYPY